MLRHLLERPVVRIALFVVAVLSGYLIAQAIPAAPVVVTVPTDEVAPREQPRRSAAPAAPVAVSPRGGPASLAVVCSLQSPDPSYVCANGYWQPPELAATSTGGGGAGRASGCVTAQPGNGFTCRDGVWVMSGVTTAPNETPPAPVLPSANPPPATPCTAPRPVVTATQTVECVSGSWVVR